VIADPRRAAGASPYACPMRRAGTGVCIAAFLVAAVACSGPAAPPTLADELAVDAGTVAAAIAGLQDALDHRYDALAQLYTQITNMRLGERVAVALDKASRVPTDAETQPTLDRYLAFGDEVLGALSDLDAAIATRNVEAAAVAAARIDAAAGSLATAVDADLCAVAVPPSSQDLCTLPEPVGDYESAVAAVFLDFVAAYRPLLRLPDAFGDVVRGAVLAHQAPEVVDMLDGVASRLGALTPDQPHVAVHQALVEFVAAIRARWAEVDPQRTDTLLARVLTADLFDITCTSADDLAAARALLLGAVPNSAIPAITGVLFDDPDTGCVDR